MHLQHNSIRVVRQYIETSQQWKPRKLCLLCSYIVNQTNTSPDSPPQQLTITGVPGAEEIEDGLAASKALNESRPRRLRRPRHLKCLVLPLQHNDYYLTMPRKPYPARFL